jgi:hypothetical protein
MRQLPRLALLTATALCLLAGMAGAQTSPQHDLHWHVVASGGASMATAGHRLQGTLGQLSSGPGASAHYILGAGYWYGIRPTTPSPGYRIYLPLVVRDAGSF